MLNILCKNYMVWVYLLHLLKRCSASHKVGHRKPNKYPYQSSTYMRNDENGSVKLFEECVKKFPQLLK